MKSTQRRMERVVGHPHGSLLVRRQPQPHPRQLPTKVRTLGEGLALAAVVAAPTTPAGAAVEAAVAIDAHRRGALGFHAHGSEHGGAGRLQPPQRLARGVTTTAAAAAAATAAAAADPSTPSTISAALTRRRCCCWR